MPLAAKGNCQMSSQAEALSPTAANLSVCKSVTAEFPDKVWRAQAHAPDRPQVRLPDMVLNFNY